MDIQWRTFFNPIAQWFSGDRIERLIFAGVLLLVGLFLSRLIASAVLRIASHRLHRQSAMLLEKFLRHGLGLVVVLLATSELGIDFKVLLGAAGILTVAIGFAAQTSASNLISGIFLILERPFVVGDSIRVDDTSGEVLSIDFLATRLRTFDNLLVRIPNETLMKSRITNFTRLPIRRVDLTLRIPYSQNLPSIKKHLNDIAERHPLCLIEPSPLFVFQGFEEGYMLLQFSVWGTTSNYLALRNGITEEILLTFQKENIEMPYAFRKVLSKPEGNLNHE